MAEHPGAADSERLVGQARDEEARLLRLVRELDLVAARQRAALRRLRGETDASG
ncbi:MAG: hypothetical protein QM733_14485 [Ilumatobacteraceae bacterium]